MKAAMDSYGQNLKAFEGIHSLVRKCLRRRSDKFPKHGEKRVNKQTLNYSQMDLCIGRFLFPISFPKREYGSLSRMASGIYSDVLWQDCSSMIRLGELKKFRIHLGDPWWSTSFRTVCKV